MTGYECQKSQWRVWATEGLGLGMLGQLQSHPGGELVGGTNQAVLGFLCVKSKNLI